MGTVYAIANQKGGVGKTTTAVNVAACIAEAGYETLLVDVDPQANATVGLGIARSQTPGLYEVLTGEATAQEALSRRRSRACRCCRRARGSPARTSSCRGSRASSSGCASAWRRCGTASSYILLDCPPSLGPLTVNALVAADRVIVPVQTEYFALEGLAGLLETLALVQRELNPG
jgi:chromosome partitioning protein